MSDVNPYPRRSYQPGRAAPSGTEPTSLADLLDRVLDKGLVIAGDISISLAQVELVTIKIRLLLASADKAKEMGIDWWTRDPALSGAAGALGDGNGQKDRDPDELAEQNRALLQRVEELESRLSAVLAQPESTATAPTAIGAQELLASQRGGRTRARRPGGASGEAADGADTSGESQNAEDVENAQDAEDGEDDGAGRPGGEGDGGGPGADQAGS